MTHPSAAKTSLSLDHLGHALDAVGALIDGLSAD
jgi:hypothetical protein